MARKVFVSILGAGPYNECSYSAGGSPVMTTRYIQLATYRHLLNEGELNGNSWVDTDKTLIFMTEKAETEQWLAGKSKENGSTVTLAGLKELADREGFCFEPIRIPNGENETQIWEIFKIIYDKFEECDKLYFDITHAFRYQPMLMMALINYAKFLKNISVKSITYGNYMAETELKPIMDLTAISVLQDWTFAAGQYIKSGNVERLVELCNYDLKPILKEARGTNEMANNMRGFVKYLSATVEERQTCRGLDIIQSTSFGKLKQSAGNLDKTLIDAFNPIFDKIKSSLVFFDENENVRNGLSAAKWCYDNGLYQQSATILQEFVVSFFCKRHNIPIDNQDNRETVNKAFNIRANNTPEEGWIISNDEQKMQIKEVLADNLFDNTELICYFQNLTELRNDINHSGMRSKRKPMTPTSIKENIWKCLEGFALNLYNIKFEK